MFPIRGDRYHIGIQPAAIHGLRQEEIVLALRNPQARSVKSSSPGRLTLWGKITDKAARVEVLDQYIAKK